MNKEILVKIYNTNKYYLMEVLLKNNINYVWINSEENYKYIKINYSDYEKLKRKFDDIEIVKTFGKEGSISFLKYHFIFLLSSIIGIIILLILSNTIFSIKVNTKDKELKNSILESLEENNIKKYSFKKSYKNLNDIKQKIINNNSDLIEWLEIIENGTQYIIEVTPRVIITKENHDETPRNIIASKDALIKHIISSNGEILKDINDYTKKGEIIISGNIIKRDTIKKQVAASGMVYGEVWYTVKTSVPYKYIEYVPTGCIINHYYIKAFNKEMTLWGKYDTKYSMNTKEVIIDKPYLFFKVVKEKKEIYEYKEFSVTKDEAYEEAIKRSDKVINNKLNEEEYIINKKVLNIYPHSSKIEVEIFYKVYENITEYELIKGSEISEE